MWKNESFYIDNWSFIQIGDVEFPNVDGQQMNVVDGISFDRPVAASLNSLAFTEADMANGVYTLELEQNGETTVYNYGDKTKLDVDLEPGKYTVTFKYIVAGYEFSSTQKISVRNFNVEFIEPRVLYETGVAYQIDLPETDLEGAVKKAYARKEGTTEWMELTQENGKANITLVGEGNYEIKMQVTYQGLVEEEIYKVVIRAKNTIADFEINEDGTHIINQGSIDKHGYITDEWSYDGKYSYYIDAKGDDFTKVNFTEEYNKKNPDRYLQFDQSYNTITMWINAQRAMSNFYIEILAYNEDGKAVWIASSKTSVALGVNQYVFTFNESFDNIFCVGWKAHYVNYTKFYVDTIRLYNVEIETPNVPSKTVTVGEDVAFEAPEVTANGLATSVTVKAKSEGEKTYTTVELVDGKYTVSFAKGGVAEIVVEIRVGGAVMKYVYNVTVLDERFDQGANDIPWVE
jgi:hypothetical protein